MYRHVLAGNPNSRIAYLGRASDIFDDINSKTGSLVQLVVLSAESDRLLQGRVTIRIGRIRGLGLLKQPYLMLSFRHNEVINYGPDPSNSEEREVAEDKGVTEKPVVIASERIRRPPRRMSRLGSRVSKYASLPSTIWNYSTSLYALNVRTYCSNN